MTTISKIKLLIIAVLITVTINSNAFAGNFVCNTKNYSLIDQKIPDISSKLTANDKDSDELKKLKTDFIAAQNRYVEICEKANDAFKWGEDYMIVISIPEMQQKIKDLGLWEELKSIESALKENAKEINNYKASPDACGENFPYGCPSGTSCFKCDKARVYEGNISTMETTYHCATKKPSGSGSCFKVENSGGKGSSFVSTVGATSAVIDTNADGETVSGHIGLGAKAQSIEELRNPEPDVNQHSNAEFCKIDQLKKDYTSNCYSCLIVANLIRTFMNAIDSTYNVTQVAGIKLLSIGMILWLAFFVINKLSSFVSIEPMDMLQELFTFFFKCLIAYTLITSGLKTLTTLIINPILIVGADYGIAVADAVLPEGMKGIPEHSDKNSYKLTNSSVMDNEVFDKIMTLSKKADAAVSTNFVIGEALICHSIHAGAINITESVEKVIPIKFYFPDIWIWLCGAIIWFFAFMVVMGVNFYLLDLSFKIGFAILAMPVMIGLWPFNKFKDKFKGCVDILINAAGTFMFLGITTGLSVLIISAALGGTEELFAAIASDNKGYVSQRFSLGGGSFIIILFAFLYAHKLISKTEGLTDKFFKSDMSGLNSMHHMTTQMIDFAKKQVGATLSLAGALVTGGASAAVKSAGRQAARTAIRKVRDIGKKKNKEKND